MATFETLEIQDRGPARIVTIHRPEALNALDAQVVAELTRALDAVAHEKAVRGVVVTGAGEKAFAAGADIKAMIDMDEAQALAFASAGHAVGEMMSNLGVPIIAAVSGFALGGGMEVALGCDFIYASERAKFGQPEVKLGVIPGFGGTQRLLRRVGLARALELVLTGTMISAEEALRLGLVNRIVPGPELIDSAVATIATVAEMGPLAIAAAKRVMHLGAGLPLEAANQLEVEAFAALFETSDQKEGMRAFVDKRKAAFRGL